MSTWAVFGMARHRAVERSRNAIKPKNGESASEWEIRVQASADKIMESDVIVQLSEKFDAPHFADEFYKIAARDGGKRLHIKAFIEKDKDPVTKKPRYHWVEWNG